MPQVMTGEFARHARAAERACREAQSYAPVLSGAADAERRRKSERATALLAEAVASVEKILHDVFAPHVVYSTTECHHYPYAITLMIFQLILRH